MEDPKMTSASILKSLLVAALLSCAAAHAGDRLPVASEDGEPASSFKVSKLRCEVVEGQVRCTFGA
jgi:hypothetical protein